MRLEIKGVYAITDTANLSSEIMLNKTEEILRAGAKVLQYRNKQADENIRIVEAKQLIVLCRQYSVPLIINDDIALAVQTGADGVHLGKTDSGIADARERLGDKAIIGEGVWWRMWTETAFSILPPASRYAPPDIVIRKWWRPSKARPVNCSTFVARISTTPRWWRYSRPWPASPPAVDPSACC